MELQEAKREDLPQLKVMYQKIVKNMNEQNIRIWNEFYPYELFEEDIQKQQLYVLKEQDEIAAAFALCKDNEGADSVGWKDKNAAALYIDRLGINVDYQRKGIGSLALYKACELAHDRQVPYVRLFVVDKNEPAIRLYEKNHFKRAEGIYDEVIEEDFILHEYGYEIRTDERETLCI